MNGKKSSARPCPFHGFLIELIDRKVKLNKQSSTPFKKHDNILSQILTLLVIRHPISSVRCVFFREKKVSFLVSCQQIEILLSTALLPFSTEGVKSFPLSVRRVFEKCKTILDSSSNSSLRWTGDRQSFARSVSRKCK